MKRALSDVVLSYFLCLDFLSFIEHAVGSESYAEEPVTGVKFQTPLTLPGCLTSLSLVGTGKILAALAIVTRNLMSFAHTMRSSTKSCSQEKVNRTRTFFLIRRAKLVCKIASISYVNEMQRKFLLVKRPRLNNVNFNLQLQ